MVFGYYRDLSCLGWKMARGIRKLPYSLVWHWKLVLAETSVAAVTRTLHGSAACGWGFLPTTAAGLKTQPLLRPGRRCMTSTTFYALESSTVRRYNFKITLLKELVCPPPSLSFLPWALMWTGCQCTSFDPREGSGRAARQLSTLKGKIISFYIFILFLPPPYPHNVIKKNT